MYYVNEIANESGNHGNPVSVKTEGTVALPNVLLSGYLETRGFCILTVEDETVTSLVINQEAYDAYMADHTDIDPPAPKTIEDLEHENVILRAQIQAMADRNDFIEDCIAEMAEIVYG